MLPRHQGHIDQHILHKDAVAHGGVADEDVGDRAHDLAVLNNGGAAHALNDSSRGGQKIGIGYGHGEALGARSVPIDIGDFYVVLLNLIGVQGAKDIGVTLLDFIA